MEESWAMFYALPVPIPDPTIFNIPNGTGSPFTQARNLEGPVDATIDLYLRDSSGAPIPNYPAEDLALFFNGAGYQCQGGTIPDSNTDANGMTTWTNPLFAGGWSEGPTLVMIAGETLLNSPLNLMHNSPDIDGNGIVNLLDLSIFAVDYFGYSFRSDFHYDGEMSLLDLSLFAIGYNTSCP